VASSVFGVADHAIVGQRRPSVNIALFATAGGEKREEERVVPTTTRGKSTTENWKKERKGSKGTALLLALCRGFCEEKTKRKNMRHLMRKENKSGKEEGNVGPDIDAPKNPRTLAQKVWDNRAKIKGEARHYFNNFRDSSP